MRIQKSTAPFKFSLPRRLIIVFMAFVLVPYAIGMAFAVKMAQRAIPSATQLYQTRVSTLSEQLDTELSRIESQIYYNVQRTPVQYMSLVSPTFSFADIYASVIDVKDIVHSMKNSSGLLDSATIYFPLCGRKITDTGSFLALNDTDLAFLSRYQSRTDPGFLTTVDAQLCMVSDSVRVAGFARRSNSEHAAVLRLTFSDRALQKWCDILPGESRVCLIGAQWDEDCYFLPCNNTTLDDAALRADLAATVGIAGTDDICQISGQELLRIVCQVGDRPLWVGCYMDAKIVRSTAGTFTVWQIVLTAFLLLEVGIFFYLMQRMVAQPINRFAREVQRLEKEGMLDKADKPGSDMDFLYAAFVDVSDRLKDAMEQSYRSKVLIYQAEIKYLQAQVNPHFLYNCFYHLYRMAKMEDNEGVAEMSNRLSSYYRYITRSDQNEVPLEMEYRNIVDYTDIQSIRFGSRIQVELEPLPDKYRELTVPRFVLQPLFENAYYHGVEKMTAGRIRLQFRQEEDQLTILVENNGACTDAELDAITAYLSHSEDGEKITALKNVKGRMMLLGGNLSVSRGGLGGFCAALTLPCTVPQQADKEDTHAVAADR